MLNIIQDFIPAGSPNRPGTRINPTYITIHNTDNADPGANAAMHADYLKSQEAFDRQVSWHFSVDDHSIHQSLPTDEEGWHAGDGGSGTGNTQSIGIEICENTDGDFNQARALSIQLVRYLMEMYNIPITNVVPHQHWSGKYCPHLLLPVWDAYIQDVQVEGDQYPSDVLLYIFDGLTETVSATLTNGAPGACPYLDAVHYEEINGANTFEFTIPADHPDSQYVKEENLVAFLDVDSNVQLYIIRQVKEEHSDVLTRHAVCEHASAELLDEIVTDLRPSGKTAYFMLDEVLAGTRWEVGIVNDLGTATTNFYYESVMSAIFKILDAFSAEVRFRVEFSGNTILHRYVDIFGARGFVTGRRFEYSRDVDSVKRTVDSYNVKTALYGRGKGEETGDGYGRKITFADIVWVKGVDGAPLDKPVGQEWLGDPDALAQFGRANGTRHRFGIYDNPDCTDPTDLLWKTWVQLEQQKTPIVTYEINAIDLEGLTGYEHTKIRLGDTVNVLDYEFMPPLVVQARVIALKRYKDQPEKTEVTLGNFHRRITDETIKIDDIQTKLGQKSGEWDDKLKEGDPVQTSWLEGEINALQNAVKAGGGSVTITDNDGILIVDNEANPTKALRLLGGLFAIADSKDSVTGDWNWRTFGDGGGFTADEIKTGFMMFDRSKGGTLTLGGVGNGNGELIVYDDNGELVADLDSTLGGFASLNIGTLKTSSAMLSNNSPDTIVYIVDPVNGSDTNDGLSNSTAFKRFQKAIDVIPKNNNGRVEIYVTGSNQTINEDIHIEGFFGNGYIYIDFGSTTTINGMIWMKHNNIHIELLNPTVNQVTGTDFIGDGTVSARHSKYVILRRFKIYSNSNVDYGILCKDSTVVVDDCQMYDGTTACIEAEYGGSVDIISDCQGSARAGLRAYGSGLISVHDCAVPHGTTTDQEVAFGGQIYGTPTTVNTGTSAPPPPPPTTQVWEYKVTRTWRTAHTNAGAGWYPADGYGFGPTPLQGMWTTSDGTNYGNSKGCFWFVDNVPTDLAGKTIISCRIKMWRYNGSGYSSARPIHLWTINQGSEIIDGPEPILVDDLGQPHSFAWGDEAWMDIPSWVAEKLRDGTIKGFCLWTSDTSNASYMRMEANALLEVTYQ